MRPPRFRLRTLNIAVAVAALTIRQVVLWDRVKTDYQYRLLVHCWERSDGVSETQETYCVTRFWPQYWRRSLALPWPGTYRCECQDVRRGTIVIEAEKEEHPYRYIGSRATSRKEAAEWWACTRSLKELHLLKREPPNQALQRTRPAAAHEDQSERVLGGPVR